MTDHNYLAPSSTALVHILRATHYLLMHYEERPHFSNQMETGKKKQEPQKLNIYLEEREGETH